MSDPNDYTVGWICAITTEYVAAQSFLDENHQGPEKVSANDNNDYTLGKIGKHNVVIAVLPDGEYGISSAASVARDMLHSFPNIRIGLMVGIGGGAPSKKHDIRLGDIVPPVVLRTAVSGLRSHYELNGHQLDLNISKILEKWKRLKRKYSRPPPSADFLYRTDIIHPLGDETGCTVLCGDCPSKLILRPERTEDDDIPSIHYGLIASANQLMKDASIRDTLAAEKDNKAWQGYAAMAAAAYAKDLLHRIPPNRIEAEKRIGEILSDVKERIIDMSQNITKIVRKQLDQEFQAILDWITPIDYASQQNDLIKSRQPGTGECILRQLSQMGSKIPPTPPSLDEIVKTLDQIIASYSRTYIIIDALDECTDSNLHRSTLMFEIFGLQTRLGANLFFTSRLVPHIEKDFESRECSTLEIRATDKDIRQYLDSNMSQLPAFIFQSTGLEERIKSSIIEASKEVFLLARLHLDSLRDKISVWQVEDALKKLPKGWDAYEQAYKGAMERIKSQKRGFCDLANRVLFWITCSRRPLSTSELQHALAVVNDSSSLNPRNLPEIGLMVSVCGGLVAVDEHSDIIRLVHYTVQEYFERTCDTWFPTAQADIAKTCITYLSFDIFKAGANSTYEVFEGESQSDGLYDYAACNWGHHVRISSDPDVNLLAVGFLESEAAALTWEQVMRIYKKRYSYDDEKPPNIGKLHMAAYFGLVDPMKALLKKHDPDSEVEDWTPIHWASLEGHEAVVKLLLENDANPNPDDWDNEYSPLKLAVQNDHTAVVRLLLEDEGFDLESQDKEGKTPLQRAAANGHDAVVRLLLLKGANLESKDSRGKTPLLEAAENGHDAVVQLLLQKGANLDIEDKWGRTPLVAAMEHNHEAAAKLLLGNSADLEAEASSLGGLLIIAAEQGYYQIVELLLESGVNPNRKPGANSTALYSAAEGGHIETVRLLLNKGADPGYILEGHLGQETALDGAAEGGHGAVMRLLLDSGATLGDKDDLREALDSAAKYGRIPLLSAARRGHEETVKFLLECGADPNAHDADGTTPLAQAAEKGHAEIVRLLLESGAKLERGKGGGRRHKDALFLASRRPHDAVVKLLLDKGAELESKLKNGWFTRRPLHYAAHIGYEAMVHQFLKNGANFDARDTDGRTPLHYAIEKGHEGVGKLLLDAGANPNRATTTTEREPPIYLAAEKGHAAMVELLLDKGASPDSGSLNSTPLSISIENGHEAVVKLLLDRGSDPNRSAGHMDGVSPDVVCGGYDGDETPLHKAANEGHEAVRGLVGSKNDAVIKLLLQSRADLNIGEETLFKFLKPRRSDLINLFLERGVSTESTDDKGSTLLQYSVQWDYTSIIRVLLAHNASTEVKDSRGETPLHMAASRGRKVAAKLLLDKGANIKSKDNKGDTPLHQAAGDGSEIVVKLLLDRGADVEAKNMADKKGRTPLRNAKSDGQEEIVGLLLGRHGN
ncbi:ankyrin repeats (3 copies) domain-containing protein [Trichoderma breve]|uniref:Ankyrin repeats (3 copies) domain-containing protein n=1 Tax=Trichoderma breve TaxID=2034170 RepID=A0A9W9ECT9_9HYPO|nr:ankyrin repeats (3 copies) domain-containing protein [Trichoderma breve]KAJ4864350.1 ankyrin repeats (3 copies) domain-containing protein [Trichoderma breve]